MSFFLTRSPSLSFTEMEFLWLNNVLCALCASNARALFTKNTFIFFFIHRYVHLEVFFPVCVVVSGDDGTRDGDVYMIPILL